MGYTIKPDISNTEAPPISESLSWIPVEKKAREFITLSQAVPNYPPARELQSHIARLAIKPVTSLYTDILGIDPLRRALANHLSDSYCGQVTPDDIAITAGANQAFCLALMALADAEDNVIVPSPYFFNHQMWLDMRGIATHHMQCQPANGMLPEPDQARDLIDERTRAIILVTPNNPTGAIYPPVLIEAFFELCAEHGIALLIDEAYKDFRATSDPAHSLFARPQWRDTFVHLHSFSKSFSLTGYRVGGMAASPQLIANVEKLMDCVAICAPRIAQDAAHYALEHLAGWRVNKAIEMDAKLAALGAAFSDARLRYRLASCGAFFAYVEHPFDGEPAKSVAMRLARQHDLLALPGSMFGEGQERYLRIAFANAAADQMDDVVARLIESQTD